MTKTQKKFLVGFFGALLLAAIGTGIVWLEMWLFTTFGFGWGSTGMVLAIALFSGLMNASSTDQEEADG